MKVGLRRRVVCFSVLAQAIMVGAADNAAQYIRTEQLSKRVLLAYWLGTDRRCNLTAIRSRKGLVIVDTEASPRVMAPIKQKIEQTFGRNDWLYVINTHAHDNHASGNSLFRGAAIVGHENLARDMEWLIRRQTEPEWRRRELARAAAVVQNLRALPPRVAGSGMNALMVGAEIKFWELFRQDLEEGYEVVKPTRTFADRLTLDLGDLTLELIFFGKGHSLSDTLVYIPQERVLITGGIVYQRGLLPEIGEDSGLQDVRRFLSILDYLLAKDVKIDRVVPSHSPPLVRDDMLPVRDYYQRMLAGMQAARREGLTFEQTARRLAQARNFPAFRIYQPGQYGYGFHERNLQNLWRIFEQEQPKPPPADKRG